MTLNGWDRVDHVYHMDQAASWRYLAKAWPEQSRWVEFKERYIRLARQKNALLRAQAAERRKIGG